MTPFRIGFGFDVHAFAKDRELWLGGVKIDWHQGLEGHSDADVVLHAVADALLGALALGDIGVHFPNTDPRWKGIDSKILLSKTYEMIQEKAYELGNLDITIIAEAPKINPHIPSMQKAIQACLHCHLDQISIKATTNEKMGYIGRGEGIAAHAVCLLFTDAHKHVRLL